MREPCKLHSIVLPYTVFERLQVVAKREGVSVGRAIRTAVEGFLETDSVRTGKRIAEN